MKMKTLLVSMILLAFALAAPAVAAEKKPGGPPPMLVAVTEVVEGKAEPVQKMVGTVYFSRVSKVAAEVSGLVSSVSVEDGDRVRQGATLVSLQTDILETAITKNLNAYEQAVLDMEQGRRDLQRLESLYAEKLIAETTYDAQVTRTGGLEKQVASLQAERDRLQLEKKKMKIRAPFSGLVLKREVEKGEWAQVGGTVAVVADDRQVDIIVDVPARIVGFLKKGREIQVVVGNRTMNGRYVAMVPKGDVATRTFSIKIRMKNEAGLIEGMEAYVSLPSGPLIDGLLVPRDAVIKQYGQQVLFLADEGKAKMVPVQVGGYQDMQVAVSGPGLAAGQQVVVKGNERIRDGQPIRF